MKKSWLLFCLLGGSALAKTDLLLASDILSWPKSDNVLFQGLSTYAETNKTYKTASICFLGFGDCDDGGFGKGDENYNLDTAAQCKNEGFVLNNCSSVQTPKSYCPYNKSYILGCQCSSNLVACPAGQIGEGASCDGKYASCTCDTNLISCPSNKVGSGASCGGKYQSCACKPEYIYTSSNCTSPRSLSGSSCDGKYTSCVCPNGVSSGAYGCETYYPSPCSAVCQKAYSDNCRNRTAVSTPYGCAEYWSDCASKCKTAYNDNCRNRTAVTCQYGCSSYFGDCQSKCQICKTNNCDNRTAVEAPYGCQVYWSDCTSKCQIAYPDNCRNRTPVSVPANATCSSYYSDCSSKCSSWLCNDGYKRDNDLCVPSGPVCQIGYIYYSDNTCVAADNHNKDKTVLGIVVYVTDGGKHGQIVSINYLSRLMWSTEKVNIPTLPDLSETYAIADFDSCGNTDKITSFGDKSKYPAAWGARNYAPTPETKGKWCLPAAGILSNIYNNLVEIRNTASVLNLDSDITRITTPSSTEIDEDYIWVSSYSSAYVDHGIDDTFWKVREYYIFPVLEY